MLLPKPSSPRTNYNHTVSPYHHLSIYLVTNLENFVTRVGYDLKQVQTSADHN